MVRVQRIRGRRILDFYVVFPRSLDYFIFSDTVFSTPVGIKRNIFASAKLFWYAAANFILWIKTVLCCLT
jgi:hypothetical protein